MKIFRELNAWSKTVIGVPFWVTMLVFCVIEYGLSFLGAK